MNTAKSYKLAILLTAFVLSFVTAFVMMFSSAPANVSAQEVTPTASNYFTVNGEVGTIAFGDKGATATLKAGDELKFKNKLVIDAFSLELNVPTTVKEFDVVIKSDSYFVNGNKNADGEFDTEIENVWNFKLNGATFDIKLNNGTDVMTDTAGTNMTLIVATVDGTIVSAMLSDMGTSVANSDAYYRIRQVDKAVGEVSIRIKELVDVETADIIIASVDQNAMETTVNSNDAWKQSFATNAEGKITKAQPRVAIDNALFVRQADGSYANKALEYKEYEVKMTPYSALGGVYESDLFFVEPSDNAWLENSDKPKTVRFRSDAELKVGTKIDNNAVVYETYTIDVFKKTDDDKAPKYFTLDASSLEIQSFVSALEKEYKVVDDNGTPEDKTDDVTHSVALGTSVSIPSFEDLVYDEFTSYEVLKEKVTLKYYNPTTSGSSSNLSISLNSEGTYTFFVMFEDLSGNKMEEDKFIIEEDGVYNKNDDSEGYGEFLFTFSVADDAPIVVKAASQGKGFVGTTYTASKFSIDASGCNKSYTLYYNPSTTANENTTEGWIEIPKASTVTDEDYDKDGYKYDDIKAIAYNGELVFTPNKVGTYKITCTAVSTVSSRSASGDAIIHVERATKVVKVPSTWLADNVWSVVFLSVGTLCLIGIIILLCIKPKDETEGNN